MIESKQEKVIVSLRLRPLLQIDLCEVDQKAHSKRKLSVNIPRVPLTQWIVDKKKNKIMEMTDLMFNESKSFNRSSVRESTIPLYDIDESEFDSSKDRLKCFPFDKVFTDEPTDQIYQELVAPIVQSAIDGINGAVFAYGQTSSGKTYTIDGIINFAVQHIFQHIKKTRCRTFLVRVQVMEIYDEVIRDLIGNEHINVRDEKLVGIEELFVTDPSMLLGVFKASQERRATAATAMNQCSSRAHTIYRIIIESQDDSVYRVEEGDEEEGDDDFIDSAANANETHVVDSKVKVGTLDLIDLAGSENIKLSQVQGQRQKEAGKINTSLLALSRVIEALSRHQKAQKNDKTQHIPYRDSKLTRVLHDSLTGNARILMICCATPGSRFHEETRSTLNFGMRAKHIQINAKVNEVLETETELHKIQLQLQDLKKKQRESSKQYRRLTTDVERENKKLSEDHENMASRLVELQTERMEQEEKIKRLKQILQKGGIDMMNPAKAQLEARKKMRETWTPNQFNPTTGAVIDISTSDNYSPDIYSKEVFLNGYVGDLLTSVPADIQKTLKKNTGRNDLKLLCQATQLRKFRQDSQTSKERYEEIQRYSADTEKVAESMKAHALELTEQLEELTELFTQAQVQNEEQRSSIEQLENKHEKLRSCARLIQKHILGMYQSLEETVELEDEEDIELSMLS